MATGKARNGKPYAGNPHVRFDEGEVAPTATPRRGSLLYKHIARTAFLAAAVAAISPLASFAVEPAALTLAFQGDNIVVTVPANNTLYDTSRLYLVWGLADCGSDVSAWPVANRIQYSGTLTTAGGTATFDGSGIPAGSVVRAIATSDVRLIDGYLCISGNRCLNTGIPDTSAYGVDFKCQPLGTSSGTYSALVASMTDRFILGMNNTSYTSYYLRYGGSVSEKGPEVTSTRPSISNITSPHTFRIFGGKLYFDNVDTKAKSFSGSCGQTGVTIKFGGASNTSNSGLERFCRANWYYAQVLDNDGSLLGNFVPALVGDSSSPSPVFYDSVSGRFFATEGSGAADTCSGSVTNTIVCLSAISDTFTTGVTAYWTGNGNRASVNDPANWACTNAVGAEVVGAYPDIDTVVKVVGASNFNVPAGQSLSFNILRFENCSLSANCDWSGLAVSTQRVAMSVLEYLEAPRGAYIDTGFKPNERTSVVSEFTVVDSSKHEYFFGAWNTSYCVGAFAIGNDTSSGLYSGFGNSGSTTGKAIANGRHVIELTNGLVKVDGDLHTNRSGQSPFQVNYNLYIFGQNRGNKANGYFTHDDQPAMRLHSFKIYDEGVLVRDYVPVLRNGEYCLYERVSRAFVYNAGTGEFAGGEQTGETVDIAEEVSVPIDFDVDLAGHSLTLVDTVGSGTITDTIGGGELHVNVASGETVENSALTFAGRMKLVKDGAGTFVGAKADQTYTGGTVANAGWLKQGAYSGSWGPHKSLITIQTGAGFDWNGKVNDSSTTAYSFKVLGTGPDGDAAMKTSVDFASNYPNANFIADMELDGDTTVKTGHASRRVYGLISKDAFEHNLEMNGHTLTVVADDSFGFRGVTATGDGTIVSVPDTSLNTGMRRLSFYGATNDLSTTTLDIHDRCGLNVETTTIVTNLIDRRTLQWNNGTKDNNGVTTISDSTNGMLVVIGRFQPYATNLFTKVTLGDALHLSPVLDLSHLTDAFGSSEDNFELAFENSATVAVDVGARATAIGDKLVSWSEMPDPSVTFTLAYDGEDREQALAVKTNGLFVVSSATPAYAMWDLEAETPGWKFYDASGNVIAGWEGGVTADIQVRFASYEEYVAIAAQGVTPSAFVLTGSFTLPSGAGTADMTTGFNWDFAEGVTIDLNGRTAVLPDAVMYGTTPFTVTSGIEGGRLEVNVATGVTATNTAMTLSGNLSLVKIGEGTFVAAKTGQTYSAGTFVNGGWLKSTVPTTSCGVAQSLITVADGAGYDWAGAISETSTMYSFDIAGTGPGGAGALLFSTLSGDYKSYCLKNLTLSDDALIVDPSPAFRNDYCGFIKGNPHVLTMNGHTLTIDTGAKFNFLGVTAPDEGTIVFMTTQTGTGNNRMASFWGADNIMSNVTLDIAESIVLNADSSKKHVVGTFIDRGIASASGSDPLQALDRFQPMTTNLVKAVALGDATHLSPILDLSALNGPFVLPTTQMLTAADGATVQIKLGNRCVKNSTPIITWTTKPSDIDNINFAACEGNFSVVKKDDGVYIRRGFVITFR